MNPSPRGVGPSSTGQSLSLERQGLAAGVDLLVACLPGIRPSFLELSTAGRSKGQVIFGEVVDPGEAKICGAAMTTLVDAHSAALALTNGSTHFLASITTVCNESLLKEAVGRYLERVQNPTGVKGIVVLSKELWTTPALALRHVIDRFHLSDRLARVINENVQTIGISQSGEICFRS